MLQIHRAEYSWLCTGYLVKATYTRRRLTNAELTVCKSNYRRHSGFVEFNVTEWWASSHDCENRLLASSCLSVRTELDGFLWNFIIEYFSKICVENPSLIKSDNNNGFLREDQHYVSNHISLSFS
jgi:hypothetical protein